MKSSALLAASALLISAAAHAADPAPAAPAAPAPATPAARAAGPSATPVPGTPNLDLPEFQNADSFWKELQRVQATPTKEPTSPEERVSMLRSWFSLQKEVASAFAKKFPEDIRHFEAEMIALRASVQLRKMTGDTASVETDAATLDEIIKAPNAPAKVKGEAAFLAVTMLLGDLNPARPQSFVTFHKAVEAFMTKFPDHPLMDQMKGLQFRVLMIDPTPEGEEILKKYAAGNDPKAATSAKAMLQQRQKLTDMKTKPLDLKFTDTKGQPVDLANLRGKVVLLDFWATWCPPCLNDMPEVVRIYQKYHDKGFEILGISLDKDKASMEAAVQKGGMTWPQYFDGGFWQNKVSSSLGINSLPAAWLIDKKGMIRDTNVHVDALSGDVDKLLAE